jgi:hypothetical protein
MQNPNYMGVMGPMGAMGGGYGGHIDQYGRPSSRPLTPTGGLQLGLMPGMGAVSAILRFCRHLQCGYVHVCRMKSYAEAHGNVHFVFALGRCIEKGKCKRDNRGSKARTPPEM